MKPNRPRNTYCVAAISFVALIALTGCDAAGFASPPTVTPFPFVTATEAPPATAPPATATVPPTSTATPQPPAPTLRGSPAPVTIGPGDTRTPSPTPTIPGVAADCPYQPQGGFQTIFQSDPGLPSAIGCPASPEADQPPQAWIVDLQWQVLERGKMLWVSALGWDLNRPIVYAIFDDGTFLRFDDTYNPDLDPLDSGQGAPPNLFEPRANLGKVWREQPGVSARLGWATAPELTDRTFMQVFTNGEMIFVVPAGETYVFKQGSPNTWLTYDVSY